ncbi:hypothetical protein CIW50_01315 [Tardiphaga sp. P9-11]|nr:hypothetical protein CIW50_01315 [Tardiphaga sp. P9-11]
MASILPMVAGIFGGSRRATSTLPVIVQLPECFWTLSCGPQWPALRFMQKRAQELRARLA